MDTRITGIINHGDFELIKKYIHEQTGILELQNEIQNIKTEIATIKEMIQQINMKWLGKNLSFFSWPHE